MTTLEASDDRPLVVVVDDLRTPLFDAHVICRTSAQAMDFLESWLVTDARPALELWLDHDLGGADTVAPVVNLLESLGYADLADDVTVYVHTANPVAAERIMLGLLTYGVTAHRVTNTLEFFTS